MSFLRMNELDLGGKRVLIRADLNVPQDKDGGITDDNRIRASLAGIRAAVDAGAAVMVMSHLGRPKEGELRPIDSLAPVSARLGELVRIEAPDGRVGRGCERHMGPGQDDHVLLPDTAG